MPRKRFLSETWWVSSLWRNLIWAKQWKSGHFSIPLSLSQSSWTRNLGRKKSSQVANYAFLWSMAGLHSLWGHCTTLQCRAAVIRSWPTLIEPIDKIEWYEHQHIEIQMYIYIYIIIQMHKYNILYLYMWWTSDPRLCFSTECCHVSRIIGLASKLKLQWAKRMIAKIKLKLANWGLWLHLRRNIPLNCN